MNTLRMGYGVRLGGDLNELRRHHRIVQSTNEIFIDDLKEAWRFKQEFPQTEVAHRWEDREGDIPKDITPLQWLTNRLADFAILGIPHDQIVIHTSNEPNLTRELVQWHIDYCQAVLALNGPKPRSLLLNFAVGLPDHKLIPMLRDLLAIMVEHPDLFYLGLHEYAPLVWTAGVNGTAPPGFNEREKRGPENRAQEYPIKPSEWFASVTNNACWFMGRWRFWAEYCHREFKKLPRIWITEYGFDDVADVEWWQQTQPRTILDPKTGKPKRLSGWKLLEAVWRRWWPQWGHEQAAWEQVRSSIPVVYEADFVAADGTRYISPVRHITWFGWSPVKWGDFDASLASSFKAYYEQHVIGLNVAVNVAVHVAVHGQPTKPIPQFEPKPLEARTPVVVRVSFRAPHRNLRSGPGTDYKDLGDVNNGDIIKVYDPTRIADNLSRWRWVEDTRNGAGWLCIDDMKFKSPTEQITEEVPVVKPEPVVIVPETPKPAMQTFTIPVMMKIEAENEEVAALVARYMAVSMESHYRQFRYDAELLKRIDEVKSVQFTIEFQGATA